MFKKEQINQEKHAASMLYFDLMSIEDYLKNERGAVNIRYSSDWQNMISNCAFLLPDNIMFLHENNSINMKRRNNEYQEVVDLLKKKCGE